MSHFTVLIIGPDPEKQLAPYQESPEEDSPYLTFVDKTDEIMKDWEKLSVREKKEYNQLVGNYAKDYYGAEERDGRYGVTENPNSKWDWYQLGGRWAGFFRLKPAAVSKYDGAKPNFSWGWDEVAKEQVSNDPRVDQAKKGDVDFEAMMEHAAQDAAKFYDYVWEFIKDTPSIMSWREMLAEEEEKGGKNPIDRARARYAKQPRVIAKDKMTSMLHGVEKRTPIQDQALWIEDLEDFNSTREAYIQDAREGAICTFAVIKNGKWFERGEMGWWACVSNEKDEQTWRSIYTNLLKDLPDNTPLAVYDCHI